MLTLMLNIDEWAWRDYGAKNSW